MQGTRVAARYAKSFIDLATEQGILEQVNNDMKYILKVIHENREFAAFLKSPVIKTEKKQAVLKEVLESNINKATAAFVRLVASHRREMYLADIATEFINQYKIKKKILTAIVTTANGIDDNIRKKVMEIVKGGTDSEVVLEEKINKDVIGGFILRVGDRQVDASIASKLSQLRQSFKESPFTKE